MKLIFVRHGQTDKNLLEKQNKPFADDNAHLNATGREQAKQVAERLKNEKIDAIFTSPYNRAMDTTKEIAKYHQDVPVTKLENLKERGCGTLVGKDFHESFDFDGDFDFINDPKYQNVEPVRDLFKRVYAAIKEIEASGYENVIVVSHGGVHHAFYAYFNNLEWKGNLRIDKMHNCDIRIYHSPAIHLQKFSPTDGQGKLDFLKNADFKVRGFRIAKAFDDVETLDQFRAKIAELNQTASQNPVERQFYWIMKDDAPVGIITLRRALDGFWLHNAGHIGIAIDRPHRGQNYGTEAFKQMCEMADREHGIKDIITMALVDNIASRTMIEKSGGEYWDTITAADGEQLARYWVKSK